MYQVWSLYYGEFLALGIWGIVLTLVRRVLFGRLCKEAAQGKSSKGKMLRAMTLKFEKSYEVKVGIYDRSAFVKKYLCQEKKFGIRLGQWRRLPERWAGLILGAGFVEAMTLRFFEYDGIFCLNRFLASMTMATAVQMAAFWFEADSLWEQAQVYLLDYISNTLYPRQIHEYEGFEEETERGPQETEARQEKKEPEKGLVLEKEEEQIFQEVLSDFLGSST